MLISSMILDLSYILLDHNSSDFLDCFLELGGAWETWDN